MTEKICGTCRWVGEMRYYGRLRTCGNLDNRDVNTQCVPFVQADFSCPRWARKPDLAEKIAQAVDEYLRTCRGTIPRTT